MKQLLQLMRAKSRRFRQGNVYPKVKRAFFPLIVYCIATFFIQEEDETVMYIVLFGIILIVGVVNLIRGFFPKHRRRGKDGHRHDSHKHTNIDGAE